MPNLKTISTKVMPGEVRDALNAISRAFNDLVKSGGVATFNDLVSGGIATATPGGGLTPPVTPDFTIPPAPTGLTANNGFSVIILTWDKPATRYLTEIYRAAVDDLGVAVKVGETGAWIYPDTPPNNSVSVNYYYWIRYLNGLGTPGPYNQITGTVGHTATSPVYMLEVLADQITESELSASLNTRIDLIDGPDTNPASVAGQVLAEATARAAAVAAEAETRAGAIVAEAAARSAEVYEEALARIAAVDNEVAARGAAMSSERTVRESAEGALAEDIDVLSAQVNHVTTGLPVTRAALLSEQTTRADADTALAGDIDLLSAQVNHATTGLPATRAVLLSEQTTRADADTALTSSLGTLSAQVNHATTGLPATRAVLLSEQTTRADADTALSADINTLSAQVNHETTGLPAAHSLISSESSARASGDEALATQIVLLSAGAGEQFDYTSIWYFDTGVESWTGNGTPTATAGWLRPANDASDPYVLSPTGLGITASQYPQIKLRIRKTGTPTFEGTLWWKRTGDETWDAGRSETVSEPSYDANGIGVIPADMGWDGTIDQIRIDVGTDQATGDEFEIDWVAIGRPAPGASTAMVYAEQTARASADSALSSSIGTLSSQVSHATTGLPATRATLLAEQTTRSDADTALSSSISSLSSQVNHETTGLPATRATLLAEQTTRSDADTALSSSIGALSSQVNNATTGLPVTRAALLSELTTRADADTALSSSIGTLSSQVNHATTGLPATRATLIAEQTTRADADTALSSSISSLSAQVNHATTGLPVTRAALLSEQTTRADADTALSSSIGTLSSQVNHATTGLPVTRAALLSEQTTRANADTALAGDISSLEAVVGDNTADIAAELVVRANADTALASSISTLSTTVGGHTTSIETVTATADGLSAQWTVKIDNNGFMSGFGLASTAADSAPLVDFTVLADRFSIINPNTTPLDISSITRSGSTATVSTTAAHGRVANDYVVIVGCDQAEYNGTQKVLTAPTSTTLTFAVEGIPASPATGASKKMGIAAVPFVVVDGVTYINTALIQNATITNAMIGNLSADKITTGVMHADRIDAATLSAISADLGAITAGSLNINNKFLVDASGNTTIQSATSGARLSIKNNVIKVYDSSGVLRVQIGDLSA